MKKNGEWEEEGQKQRDVAEGGQKQQDIAEGGHSSEREGEGEGGRRRRMERMGKKRWNEIFISGLMYIQSLTHYHSSMGNKAKCEDKSNVFTSTAKNERRVF